MRPPYEITSSILQLIANIAEKTGRANALYLNKPSAQLRKDNRIKTIQSSLGIEGNTLSFEQVTHILENKRVSGPKKDILEVENAIAVYNDLNRFNIYSLKSLLDAHGLLMKGLVKDAGKLRAGGVGITKGKKIGHVAPPPSMVKSLLNQLFQYLKTDKELMIIKSCVFHYELEFIHPFTDGNGRIGRLWQTLILKQYAPIFEFLPVETVIKQKQTAYYRALSRSDDTGNSTPFVEFMLKAIDAALAELLNSQHKRPNAQERMQIFREQVGQKQFTRLDYLHHFAQISQATASRDIRVAVDNGLLIKSGDKNTSKYRFRK